MSTQKINIYIVSILLFLSINNHTAAQEKNDVKFGKISPADFNLSKYNIIDSSSGAVIISDVGSTSFVGNNKGWFSHVFKRYTRIKIINKTAFAITTKKILLYAKDDEKEELKDVNAATYNLENGHIVETALEKHDIFEEKYDKNFIMQKFTLPGVKAGCIIEYSYTIISDFDFRLQPWDFQSTEYPCLWSEYQVAIPNLLIYTYIPQGADSLYINKSWTSHENYLVTQPSGNVYVSPSQNLNVGSVTNNHRWVMKDIKPLKIENYISSPFNYIDKIEFQLSQISDGETTKSVMSDWPKASEQLLSDKNFGGALSEDAYWLSDKIKEISGDNSDALQFAQNVYYYIRDNFSCINYNSFYIRSSLKDVFKQQHGNVGEINLLLVLMLRQKGINADPVLLSTRDNGFNYTNYPVMDKFNYLICKMQIGQLVYYLDCSQPRLGFGFLTNDCYNGQARIVSVGHPDPVYLSADSITEQKITLVRISADSEKLSGSLTETPGMLESYAIRETIAAGHTTDYVKLLADYCLADIPVSNFTVDSVKKAELPVALRYDFSINTNGENIFYFNPCMFGQIKKNPFSAETRTYPVEMPHCLDETYIFNMVIPTGYKVEEIPKSAKVSLNGTEGMFEYIIAANASRIQLRCRTVIKKANFEPGDYQTLRDFYASIVKKEAEQIVFKKN